MFMWQEKNKSQSYPFEISLSLHITKEYGFSTTQHQSSLE